MPAVHLTLDIGGDFSTSFDMVGDDGQIIDMSAYTCSAVLKKHQTSVSEWPFLVTTNTSGIHMTMSHTVTSTIPEGYYVYDVRAIAPGGIVSYPIKGKIKVGPNVTDS